MMFSKMVLHFSNMDLLGEIIEGWIGKSLLLTSLDIILLLKLLKLNVLNKLTC